VESRDQGSCARRRRRKWREQEERDKIFLPEGNIRAGKKVYTVIVWKCSQKYLNFKAKQHQRSDSMLFS